MCGLFGFSDPKHVLTQKQLRKLTGALATASEERGTDACGIAYANSGNLCIYKRPRAANRMTWLLPLGTTTVMGHTRMATQGNPKFNANNHPFSGKCGHLPFALAHNGVLHNDLVLKRTYHLPATKIETDSYVAVQLLEKNKTLNADIIGNMAEELEGSFTLTVLDAENHLYLVKGNNPLCIYQFPNQIICYASTREILNQALQKIGFLPKRKKSINLDEGEILCLNQDGDMKKSYFQTREIARPYWWDYTSWYAASPQRIYKKKGEEQTPLEQLMEYAENMGFAGEDVLSLMDMGYEEEEVEMLLNHPHAFYMALMGTAVF